MGTICGIEGMEVSDIGIIDIRDSLSYVEVLHGKGGQVLEALQTRPIKGKVRKVRKTRGGFREHGAAEMSAAPVKGHAL